MTEVLAANENNRGRTLGDLVSVHLGKPDADFWVVRRGRSEDVGRPSREFNPEHFGVTVVRTDLLLPDYLFYMLSTYTTRATSTN